MHMHVCIHVNRHSMWWSTMLEEGKEMVRGKVALDWQISVVP